MNNPSGSTNWKKKRTTSVKGEHPVTALQRQMNRVVTDFFSGQTFLPEFFSEPLQQLGERWSAFSPNVNVIPCENEILVLVELPGMDERDVELSLTRETLTIRGERKQSIEFTPREGASTYFESSFGAFERTIQLQEEVDENGIDASFTKGILAVRLPLREPTVQVAKKVSIRSA